MFNVQCKRSFLYRIAFETIKQMKEKNESKLKKKKNLELNELN